MNFPFVSIIVPARNEERIIKNCIEALKDLDYPAFEIVVVNNNSSDRTQEIALSLNVLVLNEPYPGRGRARNRGWKSTNSEWIAFVDADCQVEKHWLRSLIVEAQRTKANILQGPIVPAGDEDNFLNDFRKFRLLKKTHGSNSWLTVINKQSPMVNGAAFLVQRKCLEKLDGFDENLLRHQDIDFSRRAFLDHQDVCFVPEAQANVFWKHGWVKYFLRSYQVGKLKQFYRCKWNDSSVPPSDLLRNLSRSCSNFFLEKDIRWLCMALDELIIFVGDYLNPIHTFPKYRYSPNGLSFILLPEKIIVHEQISGLWKEVDSISGHVLRQMSGKLNKEELRNLVAMDEEVLNSYRDSLRTIFKADLANF